MNKYNVPVENVLRHYDVWDKKCPEPFVRQPELWEDFKRRLTGSEDLTMSQYTELKELIEKQAAEIADLKALINLNIEKCWHEKRRLERYIQSIDDSLIRQIFQLRYIEGKKWEEVADKIKGVTADSIKKQCYRYIRHSQKNVPYVPREYDKMV